MILGPETDNHNDKEFVSDKNLACQFFFFFNVSNISYATPIQLCSTPCGTTTETAARIRFCHKMINNHHSKTSVNFITNIFGSINEKHMPKMQLLVYIGLSLSMKMCIIHIRNFHSQNNFTQVGDSLIVSASYSFL